MTEAYWISKTIIVDWVLTDPTTGAFVPGATVAGTMTLPAGTTAAMVVTALADRYRLTYDPTTAGRHAWRATATGAADSAEEGIVRVRRSLVGLAAIETDRTTTLGRLRLLITDVDEDEPLFEDVDLTAFLAVEGSVLKKAAALALETIATSEVLISKKIRTQDLSTDGPAVAKELRERAAGLRAQAKTETDDAATATDDYGFDFVDFDQYAAYRTTA